MASKFQVQLTGTIDTASTIEEVNKKIAEMEKKLQKLDIKVDVDDIKESNQSLNETTKAVDDVIKKYKLLYTEQAKNTREQIKLDAEAKVNASKRNAEVLDSIQKQIAKHKELTDAMETAVKNGRSTSDVTNEYKSQLDAVNLALKEQWSQYNANKKEMNSLAQVNKFAFQEQTKAEKDLMQLELQRKNNKKVANSVEAQNLELLLRQKQQWIKQYDDEIKKNGQVTTKAKEYENQIEAINAEIGKQKIAVRGLLNEQMNIWDRLVEKAQDYFRYALAAATLQQAVRVVKEMVNNVIELDSALVELRKVTDLEGESLDRFVDKAYETGQKVAATGKDVIEASTSFAKSGYDPETALQLGEIALMYTNIADEEISAADAADMIIAQMKAFNIGAKDSMHIIDAINEV